MQKPGETIARISELRSADRHRLVYRPALIEADGFSGFCMVRNLSANGMKAQAYVQFAVGKKVLVELSQLNRVGGEVIWSDGSNMGVNFNHAVDVAAVLAGTEGVRGNSSRGRPLRLSISCTAKILTGRSTFPVGVSYVSHCGLKVALTGVNAGEEIGISLPFHEPKKAIVRWTQDGSAGLNFVVPMKYNELAEWGVRVQEDFHRRGHCEIENSPQARATRY